MQEQMKQVEIDESVTLTLRQLAALAAHFGMPVQPVSEENADLRVTIAHGTIPAFTDENDQLVEEQRGLFAFGVDDAMEKDGIMLL